jgi:acetyltransferase-like isoleucine patch superfamily enzyme
MSKIRLLILALIAFLPSFLKRLCYRLFFGYKIGKNVKIGLTLLDAKECEIDSDVTIGHLNVLIGIKKLSIGDHSRIGHLNIIRGGDEVRLGRYTEILRLNEINAIPEPIAVNEVDSRFILGDGSIITTSHKIDFTDRVEFGKRVILGGRDYSYIGSEIRIVPGGEIPPKCIVGIGAVITRKFEEEYKLIAGVPAKAVKDLDEDGKFLTTFKTRPDLPDDI